MGGRIYNIPATCSFVDTLAGRFGNRYKDKPVELAQIIFLVPTRRTALSLKEAFIRYNNGKPAVLPKILAINDIESDDVFLDDADTQSLIEKLPPAIDSFERLFIFAKLIVSRPREYGIAPMTWGQAFSLAQDLAKMLDTAYNEHLSFAELKNLVPEQYAAHWQETLKFLQIITSYWPEILKERGVIDAAERQNMLLDLQVEKMRQNPPEFKIVSAGLTGAFPALKNLIGLIAALEDGEIYLHGLDRFLSDESWELIDENHAQFDYKNLLEFLQIHRDDIKDCVAPKNIGRDRIVSEIMRPAADTWHWRSLLQLPLPPQTAENLHIINCSQSRQEALCAALILRDTLNKPGQTAALVTSDRNLARRTASELERWGIKIDDSAGKPLHLTPVGIFLRLLISAVEKNLNETSILSILKNPLTHLGEDSINTRQKIRQWEKLIRTPRFDDEPLLIPDDLKNIITQFKEIMRPLVEIYALKSVDFKRLLETHLQTAEKLAGAENIWRGGDGRQAAQLISKMLAKAEVVGCLEPYQYLSFITGLLSSDIVRSNYNSHPRLKILGPIEARFNHFDTVIIGSTNEGMWPASAATDPWLSRPMKKEFGMPLPERAIGVMAADFSRLLCASNVYLTRSARVDGTPMNKSRWLLRLETVLSACGYDMTYFYNAPYLQMSEKIDKAQKSVRINPPLPKPPLYARPRRLSVSAVEKLMRDPYEIFAAKILKLKPLQDLDMDLSANEYGSLIHKIFEIFCLRFPTQLPQNAREILHEIGAAEFAKKEIKPEVRAFWWPKFIQTVDWFAARETSYRPGIAKVYGELKGALEFEAAGGKFVLEARADRVDETIDGQINIIDYKTGEIRTNKEIEAGYAPQLALEGLIAAKGGFADKEKGINIPQSRIGSLSYWQLGIKTQSYNKDMDKLIDDTLERLKKLISVFDFADTGYASRPNPKHLLKYADYEHLARVKEWSSEENND